MMLDILLGLSITVAGIAGAQEKPADDPYKQALECRVYTELAKAVHADDPSMVAMDRKLHDYWLKRSVKLGAKAGQSAQAVSMKSLVIPLEADRFKPVMLACLAATPEKELR